MPRGARRPSQRPPRPRRPISRLISVVAGVLLLAGLILLAAFARPGGPAPAATTSPVAVASATPTPTPTATVGPPLPAACAADVRGTAFAVGSLDDRIAALRGWVQGGGRGEASLVLTDAVLTEMVRAAVARPGSPPVQDVTLIIRSDGLRLSATAVAAFFRFPIRAMLVPQVSGGRLGFAVRDLETGGLPSGFRQQVSDLITQAADPASWQLPLDVTAVVLRSGCGVIWGTASP